MSCKVSPFSGNSGGGTLIFDDNETILNGQRLKRDNLSIDISSYTFLEFYMKYEYRGPFLAYGKVLCSTLVGQGTGTNYTILGMHDLNGSSTGYDLLTYITVQPGSIISKLEMYCLSGYDSSGQGSGDARLTIYGL